MADLRFELDFVPPYDLGWHLEAPGASEPAGATSSAAHVPNAHATRSFRVAGRPVVLRLTQDAPDAPVRARAVSGSRLSDIEAEIRAAGAAMICARDDLRDFHAAVTADPAMARLAELLPGLKPMRVPDLWTTLLRSLVAQQISTAAARTIRERFARVLGEVVEVDGEAVAVLPSPEAVMAAPEEKLTSVGLSGRKREYVREMARAFLEGDVVAAELAALPPDEAIGRLVRLRGIGAWTAECTLLFGAAERDLLPADDLGIQQAVRTLYRLAQVPAAAEVRALGERWAGWRSYAAVYLWSGRRHGVLEAASAAIPAGRRRRRSERTSNDRERER